MKSIFAIIVIGISAVLIASVASFTLFSSIAPLKFNHLTIPDHLEGEDPEIDVTITFDYPFSGIWGGSIRNIKTGRTVPKCKGSGAHNYGKFAGTTRSPDFTLREYIGAKNCILRLGKYDLTVCINPDDPALTLVCFTSPPFLVKENKNPQGLSQDSN